MTSLPLKITGIVTHGKKLGTEFNMPTANIVPDVDVSGLKFGVYYSKVYVDGKIYKSISNLGTKPTVKDERDVNLETFIFDFTGDLYEKELVVELLEFRRPEMKFSSLEELRNQMRKDLEAGAIY